jgi:hypothetical protein
MMSIPTIACVSFGVLLLFLECVCVDAYFLVPMSSQCTRSAGGVTRLLASVEDKQNDIGEVVTAADPLIENHTDPDSEEKFKEEIRSLCLERNLPLEKVKNCRDLAATAFSPIKPGRLFRTGRLGDATEKDRRLLFETLGISTLVDLRSPTELKDDPALMADVFEGFTDLVWTENGLRRDGC